jgi:hypothetical protein
MLPSEKQEKRWRSSLASIVPRGKVKANSDSAMKRSLQKLVARSALNDLDSAKSRSSLNMLGRPQSRLLKRFSSDMESSGSKRGIVFRYS